MAVRNPLLPFAGAAAPFVRRIMWRSRGDNPLLDTRYDYGYPGFSTKSGADLYRLISIARRDLHAVQCPLLIVQSHQDQTITANSAEIIAEGVGSKRVGMLWLSGVPHVCTISSALPQIAHAIGETFRNAEGE